MPPNYVFSGKRDWAWDPWEPDTQSTCLCITFEILQQFGQLQRDQVSSKLCPVQYGEFYISEYFVCFDLQKINWKKSNDQKVQQSGCFKQNQNRCCSWFEISKLKPYTREQNFRRNGSIHRRRSPNTKILTTSRFQAEWQQQHAMVIKMMWLLSFKLLFWTA